MANIVSQIVDKDRLAVGTKLKVLTANEAGQVSDDLIYNNGSDDLAIGTEVTIVTQASDEGYTEFTAEGVEGPEESGGFCINDDVEFEIV